MSKLKPLEDHCLHCENLIKIYKDAESAIRHFRFSVFKPRAYVKVMDSRYNGYGVVSESQPWSEPDQLSVILCHGQDRWYPLTNCYPVLKPSDVPQDIQRVKRGMAARIGARTKRSKRVALF